MLDEATSAFLDSILSTASAPALKQALVTAAHSDDVEVAAMIALGYIARLRGARPTADLVLRALVAADEVLRSGTDGPKQ